MPNYKRQQPRKKPSLFKSILLVVGMILFGVLQEQTKDTLK
jgi:hypothetical protein